MFSTGNMNFYFPGLSLIIAAMGCSAEYLYIPGRANHSEAISLCAEFGMSLIELTTQSKLDEWNAVRPRITSSTDIAFWMGLIRDERSPSNYTWLNNGPATWLIWPDGEPDGVNVQRCVRYVVKLNKFRTYWCDEPFSVACQGSGISGPPAEKTYTKQRNNMMDTSGPKSRFKKNAVPTLDSSWIMDSPLQPPGDLDSCLFACHVRQNCVMAYYRNSYACLIFLDPAGK